MQNANSSEEPVRPFEENFEGRSGEDEMDEEMEEANGDAGEEGALVKAMKSPDAPTEEETERHMLTHIPFR